jgi:hypothetical protein
MGPLFLISQDGLGVTPGMGQRLAFVAEQRNNVARLGLALEKLQAKPRLL